MKNVKTYELIDGEIQECPCGEYVLYEDYDELVDEINELKNKCQKAYDILYDIM